MPVIRGGTQSIDASGPRQIPATPVREWLHKTGIREKMPELFLRAKLSRVIQIQLIPVG